MDIRSGLDGLKSILGVTPPEPSAPRSPGRAAAPETGGLDADQVTFSSAASHVAETASSGSDVRGDKVAGIQAALASGSYSVPASAVASRVVDFMLGNAN